MALAADAYAGPGPSYARAALADVAGEPRGLVVVTATSGGPARAARTDGVGPVATWSRGEASVASSVSDGRLLSRSATVLEGLALFGGRVTADLLAVTAVAEATASGSSARAARLTLRGLEIDGAAVSVRDLPLEVPGLGVVSALTRTLRGVGGRVELVVTGLRVRLLEDWQGLAAGREVVVGSVAAGADTTTARRLLAELAPPKPAQPKPRPSPDAPGGTTRDQGTGRDTGEGREGSAGRAGEGRPFTPGPMPAPREVCRPLVALGPAVFPVAGRFWYGHDWHAPRATGRLHLGCDIFARRGTPLVAVQDGVVTRLLTLSLGGISLRLVNERGDYFYYAHLLRYAPGLRDGQRVRKGQVIGYVGNSGNARTTPPHVHFEVHPGGGAAVDPFPYLELSPGTLDLPCDAHGRTRTRTSRRRAGGRAEGTHHGRTAPRSLPWRSRRLWPPWPRRPRRG